MKTPLQVSLRELLFLVLLAAIGLASLRAGGIAGSIVIMLAIVATMGAAIVAFVGRHSMQAFAIGFLLPVLVYGAAILVIGQSELDPNYRGGLPTSSLLRPAFRLMVKVEWMNLATGQIDPNYDVATDPTSGAVMIGQESLNRHEFMALGHVLFAMLFGYAGAKFAVAVHRKQQGIQTRPGERAEAAESGQTK